MTGGDGDRATRGQRSEDRMAGGGRNLSKSSVAVFQQCPKRLWLSVHLPEASNAGGDGAHIAAGHLVGQVARSLVPGGVLVDGVDLHAAAATTAELLAQSQPAPIFEATFAVGVLLVRVDILQPDGPGSWRLIEVKSGTDVRPEHLRDIAIQVWAATAAGCQVSGAALRYIDRTFVLKAERDYRGAFIDRELFGHITSLTDAVPLTVEAAKKTLAGPEPKRDPGPHCSDPHDCPFTDHCRAQMPPGPEWPVTVLPNGGGKRWLQVGITDLAEIDATKLRSAQQLKVHRATITGKKFHDVAGARSSIEAWPFPRIWLDFETIAFPLPRWVGTRPYEQAPFQFSAHIEHEDGRMEHREFLSLGGDDPRRPCAEALASLPPEGAVVAYNAQFERGCILRLADAHPDLSESLSSLSARLVDLLPVTRATWYHRDQRGSWSIKAVLPTLAELSYDGMAVKDGMQAQAAYLEAITGAAPPRIAEIDLALRRYCRLDTEAMIAVARRLVQK